ncbi:TM2 domain-containing protein [Mycobacterium yunnanensis]|uniref:TM2 domain-containing protein n=1 Tax=Mycobacterium yunnanensis TaxID=368477 RepID=A0A9X2Z5T1_9MYCO|nr:TM2 domain-containing protein [Mycobacterium yunnanensis]MCV7422970.1 TM2 domain-containing protein [Mycobacterium yunnanensis]
MSLPPPLPPEPNQPYPGSNPPYPPPPPPPYGGYPPPPYPGQYGVDAWGRPLSDKSKLVAGLLQLFLGTFGIGRFYLGYNGIAVAQLAVSLLTCGIGAIWPFVDGILILVGKVPDPQGRPLRD